MISFNPTKPSASEVLLKGNQQGIDRSVATPAPPVNVDAPITAKPNASLMQVYFGGLNEAKEIISTSAAEATDAAHTELINFDEYLTRVYDNPRIVRNSPQRIYDMIAEQGKEAVELRNDAGEKIWELKSDSGDKIFTYNFFTNPEHGEDSMFGAEQTLHSLVKAFEQAAIGAESFKRIIVLVGPVGTAKSTTARLIKKGLEHYTRQQENALYNLEWHKLPEEVSKKLKLGQGEDGQWFDTVIEDHRIDPLALIPDVKGANGVNPRQAVFADLNKTFAEKTEGERAPYQLKMRGELPPKSKLVYETLKEYYQDQGLDAAAVDAKVRSHAMARRVVFDEMDRVGVGTYMPKDEKNQDSEELNGGTDFGKLAEYGDETHPFAKHYRGEFSIANRGFFEGVEVFKMQEEFLYDFLSVATERVIKPKHSAQIPTDVMVMGHTNIPEYFRVLGNPRMEALRDRVIEIPFPYETNYKNEAMIQSKTFLKLAEQKGYSVAPHTLDIPAMWAVATRLDESKKFGPSNMLDKVKLYNQETNDNNTLGTYNAEKQAVRNNPESEEGIKGVSPRYLQVVNSDALTHSKSEETSTITPFMILDIIEDKIKSPILQDDRRPEYMDLLAQARSQLKTAIRADITEALRRDTQDIDTMFQAYIKNLKLWGNEATEAQANTDLMTIVEKLSDPDLANADSKAFRDKLLRRLGTGENLSVESVPQFRDGIVKYMYQVITSEIEGTEPEFLIQHLTELPPKADGTRYDEASAKQVVDYLTDAL